MHANVYTLALKKVWDEKDKNLFMSRFTAEGYKYYWEAVDKTIRYFDSVILKKNDKWKKQKMGGGNNTRGMSNSIGSQKDKFRWQNPNLHLHSVLLPPPPAR